VRHPTHFATALKGAHKAHSGHQHRGDEDDGDGITQDTQDRDPRQRSPSILVVMIKRSIYSRCTDQAVHLFPWYKPSGPFIFRGTQQLKGQDRGGAHDGDGVAQDAHDRDPRQNSPFILVVLINRSIYFRGTNQAVHLFSWYCSSGPFISVVLLKRSIYFSWCKTADRGDEHDGDGVAQDAEDCDPRQNSPFILVVLIKRSVCSRGTD